MKKSSAYDKILKENEILAMNNEIITMKTRIKKITPEYQKLLSIISLKS